MSEFCFKLDSYLLGDLSPVEATAFEEHLVGCEECREVIDQQQWIDRMLHASSHLESQVPPSRITDECRHAVASRASFRRRVISIAFATAATLLIAATWLLNHSSSSLPAQVATTSEQPTIPPRPKSEFAAANDSIAVPIKSNHSDVTIVRIYPALQPKVESTVATFEPESATSNPIDFSNGG
jgi:anti-sigma factor RsiW